jgi:hypothetical protein
LTGVIAAPALCRLCRQPLPRAAVKCPSCRARVTWPRPAPAPSTPAAGRAWRIAACLLMVALLAVGALAYRAISRDLRAPVSAGDAPTGRPSTAECADVIAGLMKAPSGEPSVPVEVRDRLRQCLERR